jgi:DNA end-binding protein Ku
LRNKEHPVLIHAYRGALILTTLLYADEVVDPLDMDALQTLGDPSETELALAEKIIDNLSGEFHVEDYNDGFKAKVEQAIQQKIQGETIVVEEPKSEDVKELMEALQETLKRLQTT